ncbi:MAG TPA: hypothetical protein VGF17_23710 [Phytomonospora sp.]
MNAEDLVELHLHLYGCIGPSDLLRHIAAADPALLVWDGYEQAMSDAYGTIPAARELVERYRAGDPAAEAAFAELFVMGEADAGNFARFSAKFQLLFIASVVAGRRGTLDEIAAEVAAFTAGIRADHARQGIGHAEIRCLLGEDLRLPVNTVIIDTLLSSFGPNERLVLSLDRADPWPGWERVQELALGPHGETIVGIDFCHVEEGHPPKNFARLFAAVAAFNTAHPERALAILHHVGESFTDKSLESAVRWVQQAAELGAHRLGHAIALGVDPAVYGEHARAESAAERIDQIDYDLAHAEGLAAVGVAVDAEALRAERASLAEGPADAVVAIAYDTARLAEVRLRQRYAMARVREAGAVVEVCPTSNLRIGGIGDPAHHPVHRFHAEGVPFVVSSDDPGIFGTTLSEELDWVCEHTGGGPELRRELLRRAWDARSEVLSGRHAAVAGVSHP